MANPTEAELREAIRDIVHDYMNLVSSGEMTVQGGHLGHRFAEPLNHHVGEAFLMNCRKMYEFFTLTPSRNYIRACHYVGKTLDLPNWKKWHGPMNNQLLHISLVRVTDSKEWDGRKENAIFLREFKLAWKKFTEKLGGAFHDEFMRQIEEKRRNNDGYKDLALE